MTTPSFASRISGGWIGKSVGGTLGIPAEGRMERLSYTFYDPIPTSAPPNDDLELQLVWLHLLETRGVNLTQKDLADGWLAHIHYMWDEYGRCRWNLRRGVPAAEAGTFENPFASGMGSPIRSEIWAAVSGGDAALAERYAALDASLDHGVEGIAGEVFFAGMQARVLAGVAVEEALRESVSKLDAATETAAALLIVLRNYDSGVEAWACRDRLLAAHDSENFTHAPLNVALTAWALLYGKGDFEDSILLAVNGGYDTDCTGATVGATLGMASGEEGIPRRWRDPIGDALLIGPGIQGIDAPQTLTELTRRTVAIAEQIRQSGATVGAVPTPTGKVLVADLPGTIEVSPVGNSDAAPWANGELPPAAKAAGGMTWRWTVNADEYGTDYQLIALAPGGCRLYLDDELVLTCSPGTPYVPATHRSACQRRFTAAKPEYAVRVELDRRGPEQNAGVMLATGNLHLAPWSGVTLPYIPRLAPRG